MQDKVCLGGIFTNIQSPGSSHPDALLPFSPWAFPTLAGSQTTATAV